MLIEKKLNYTEKKYGYLFWPVHYDNQINETLKNIKNIDIKIGDVASLSRKVDLKRRRIYIGTAIKNINCDAVKITITSKNIVIKCR